MACLLSLVRLLTTMFTTTVCMQTKYANTTTYLSHDRTISDYKYACAMFVRARLRLRTARQIQKALLGSSAVVSIFIFCCVENVYRITRVAQSSHTIFFIMPHIVIERCGQPAVNTMWISLGSYVSSVFLGRLQHESRLSIIHVRYVLVQSKKRTALAAPWAELPIP